MVRTMETNLIVLPSPNEASQPEPKRSLILSIGGRRYEIRTSLFCLARRRARWVKSDSLTGVTTDQCLPTGQRCTLHQPNRSALRDTPGIQSVVNR